MRIKTMRINLPPINTDDTDLQTQKWSSLTFFDPCKSVVSALSVVRFGFVQKVRSSFRHTYRDHAARHTCAGSANVVSPKQGGITRRKVAGLFCYSRRRSRLVETVMSRKSTRLNRTQTAHASSDRPGTRGLIWRLRALAYLRPASCPDHGQTLAKSKANVKRKSTSDNNIPTLEAIGIFPC